MRLTTKECIELFQNRADEYAPLQLGRVVREVPLMQGFRADAIIKFTIPSGPSFKALVEIMPSATPRKIREKCVALSAAVDRTNDQTLVPLVIAPYIGRGAAEILAEESISWIDLSGNMRVQIPNRIYIERIGKPNQFPDTAPIKKVFRGTSSLVSRALLLVPAGFSSLYELVDFINGRNGRITMGTVSKVLKSLEEELLIERARTGISVSNAERLLERLAEDYTRYKASKETESYSFAPKECAGSSARLSVEPMDYLACGFYAAQIKGLATTNERTIYVKDIGKAGKTFDPYLVPDAEYGNLKFIQTRDSAIWFNSTEVELDIAPGLMVSMPVVDDIALHLEMTRATPRGPEIAEQLKRRILKLTDIDG